MNFTSDILTAIVATSHPATEAVLPHFDWIPTISGLIRAGVLLLLGEIAALVLLWRFRPLLYRARIWWPSIAGAQCIIIYLAAWAVHPQHMATSSDPLAWWVRRVFAAALLLITIRIIDRIALVPVLTRRGKIKLQRFIHQIILAIVYLFSVFIFLSWAFGLHINKFLAGSAIISIVLGLALQETLSNIFSGMVMQASSPFNIGDWIACAGVEGRVVDMTWRAVTVLTLDDNHVLIPNSMMSRDRLTNYALPTVATARLIRMGIDYPSPPDQVRDVLLSVMKDTPDILTDPAPLVFLTAFGDSSIEYTLKFWIADPARHPFIENHVRMLAWYRVRNAGMSFPFPIRTVEMTDAAAGKKQSADAALQRRERLLSKVQLLAALTEEERGILGQNMRVRLYEAGQIIYRQGDVGNSLLIVESGQVELTIAGAGSRHVHSEVLGSGECFGEFSACVGGARTATVKAVGAPPCLEIAKSALHTVFTGNAAAMEKVSALIAQRHDARARLVEELQLIDDTRVPQETLYNSLLGRMKKFFNQG